MTHFFFLVGNIVAQKFLLPKPSAHLYGAFTQADFFADFSAFVFSRRVVKLSRKICSALIMIAGVIETFAICHLYRFHWP